MDKNCGKQGFVVTSGKGGVGKTTPLANVSSAFSRLGYTVL